jgi:signal transduction histidine kinase
MAVSDLLVEGGEMELDPRQEAGALQDDAAVTGLRKPSGRGEHLLVVDDEESVAFTVSEVLRRDGYAVDSALSGDEALRKIKEKQYDLVLTDLHMEGIDGITVLERIRRNAPLTISIVLTGYASLESAISAMRHGAYDYLIKPCMIDDLKLTIRRGLDHRRLVLAEQRMMRELKEINEGLEDRVRESTAELVRANQELSEASKAKDVFFAILSHELRTPLTAILGWVKILRVYRDDTADIDQGLSAIERNGELLKNLINQLLDVSRMISGKLQVELEPVNLCELVEAEVSAVKERAAASNITIEKEIPEEALVIQGSVLHLHEIVSNLISNAIKYSTDGGTVQVKVSAREGEVMVEVRDRGIGIDRAFLPKVFELFSQQKEAQQHSASGLGLGLAIVRSLTAAHNGWVLAESDGLDKGSTFTVGLPLSQSAVARGEIVREFASDGNNHSVLVIEDSADTLDLFRALFRGSGYQVVTATSGKEALEVLETLKPGIIVSDIGMPGMNGHDLIKEIRRRPGFTNIPAIAISGYATEEDRAKALAAGFADHMPKPVDPDQVVKRVVELLSMRN